MKQIFEEVELGGLKLRNRLVRSATWEGIAAPDGGIDDVAYEIYDELARGGVGAIITGFTRRTRAPRHVRPSIAISRSKTASAFGRFPPFSCNAGKKPFCCAASRASRTWRRPSRA